MVQHLTLIQQSRVPPHPPAHWVCQKREKVKKLPKYLNPILHTIWLDSHALTYKNSAAKCSEPGKI
jgi:hypothetical protein